MADGGRAETQEEMIDRAARILAAALATGSPWISRVNYERLAGESSGDLANPRELIVAEREERKGRRKVLVSTLRDHDRKIAVRRLRVWRYHKFAADPVYNPSWDALGALAIAKLDGPLEATLLLYATGDVHRYWPTVELYGLACLRNAFAWEALTDAMQRILCGRAAADGKVSRRAASITSTLAARRETSERY
ncbi:MAG TPA: hypothetical protein VGN46_17265 [Luteibacter sp.]|jgi:hypothetical protein|uniref:hypothetical protein n=1 Tax=Luteibacter sp. TaxID=1886636 RepID=UPI002F3FD41F